MYLYSTVLGEQTCFESHSVFSFLRLRCDRYNRGRVSNCIPGIRSGSIVSRASLFFRTSRFLFFHRFFFFFSGDLLTLGRRRGHSTSVPSCEAFLTWTHRCCCCCTGRRGHKVSPREFAKKRLASSGKVWAGEGRGVGWSGALRFCPASANPQS